MLHPCSNRVNCAVKLHYVIFPQISIKPAFANSFDDDALSNLNHSFVTLAPIDNTSGKYLNLSKYLVNIYTRQHIVIRQLKSKKGKDLLTNTIKPL